MSLPDKTSRPVRAVSALTLALSAVLVAAAPACGNALSGTPQGEQTPDVTVTLRAAARILVRPTTLATPAFVNVSAKVVGFEALADSQQTSGPKTLATTAVPAASSSCADEGCAFNVEAVAIAEVTRGLFVALDAGSQWQPTYSLVTSPNQIFDAKRSSGVIEAFSPASLLSVDTFVGLARLAGTDAATLLARGVTLAFVSDSRSNGNTLERGVANALVAPGPQVQGVELYYPDDGYTRVQGRGTNADGAVLIVGPPVAATAPASYAYPVSVTSAASGLVYTDTAVILRPNTFIVTSLLPTR